MKELEGLGTIVLQDRPRNLIGIRERAFDVYDALRLKILSVKEANTLARIIESQLISERMIALEGKIVPNPFVSPNLLEEK